MNRQRPAARPGRPARSIRWLLSRLLGVLGLLVVALVAVATMQLRSSHERADAERRRFESFKVADGMRQSSNDLTQMVRLYVSTGETHYREIYEEILAIRNGTAPRPVGYDATYWNRVLARGDGDVDYGPPASLVEQMRAARFTDDEFDALNASLRASDALARLEVEVMDRVAARIARGVDAGYAADVGPDYGRLTDQAYLDAKDTIMEAVVAFTGLVDERTGRAVSRAVTSENRLIMGQLGILAVMALVGGASFVVSRRTFHQPLTALLSTTRDFTTGRYDQRAEVTGASELQVLAEAFNEMAASVQSDLAAREDAEAAARAAQRHVTDITDNVPGAVFHLRGAPDGTIRVLFASRGTRVHGVSPEDAMGGVARIADTVVDDREGWLESLRAAVRSRTPWTREYRVRRADGTTAWIRSQAIVADGRDGSAEVFGCSTDVTALKETETELLAARETAEHASRAKSTFLAAMSHEIRTPMIGVTGMLEVLAHTALTPQQRHMVSISQSSAHALIQIIGDILDFSKIEAGRLEVVPVPFALGATVQATADTFVHTASARGLLLSWSVDARLAGAHVGDQLRVRQILSNFLSNAVKFTEVGGIEVAARVVEERAGAQVVELSVTDTGIGLSLEEQQRLFQPFGQADAAVQHRFGGSGLGLVICRRLADLMGGSVTMSSSLGRGTTMRLTLPLVVADPAEVAPAMSPATDARAASRPKPERDQAEREGSLLLLAEDHPVNRTVLCHQLDLIGFHVDTAEDGREALERFRSGRYAAVLTDLNMPLMSGYELAEAIRNHEAATGGGRTPIIALTANVMQGEPERCAAAGMDDFAAKPTTIPFLAGKLRRWLPHLDWPAGPDEAVAPAGGPPADPVDAATLEELTGGDAALAAAVLRDFLDASATDIEALDSARRAEDAGELRRQAHRIKGACRMVGARHAAGTAQQLESLAAGAGVAATPAMAVDWEQAEQLAVRLRRELDDIGARHPDGNAGGVHAAGAIA